MTYGFEDDKSKADIVALIDAALEPLGRSVAELSAKVNSMWSTIYPVGSIYISTASTSPRTLFGGGTWERYGGGRFLLSVAPGNSSGATGGAASQTIKIDWKHKHDILNPYTGDNIFSVAPYNPSSPDHAYTLKPQTPASSDEVEPGKFQYIPITVQASNKYFTTDTQGDTTAATKTIDTLPPYISVYMWRRTS